VINSPHAAGRRPQRAGIVPPLVLAVAVGWAAGCGRTVPPTAAPAVAASAPAFTDQLAAVRAGVGTAIHVADRPLESDEWEALRGLAELRELVLDRGRADDSRADVIGSLVGLERLVLRASPVGDEGFRAIGRLAGLRDLNVPQAACTADGLLSLAALSHLRSLRIGGRNLHGAEVGAAVEKIAGLRSLHLVDVEIGDEGLAAIGRLPGLWNLYLDGAGVSDAAWGVYFQRHPDVHVHVDQAHHDRDPHGGR